MGVDTVRAKDHQRILKEYRQRVVQRETELRAIYQGQIDDSQRVIDLHAESLDRQDNQIALLTQMLNELGITAAEIYSRLDAMREQKVQP